MDHSVRPLERVGTNQLYQPHTQDGSVAEASDFVNLPFRTVTADANIEEYLQETRDGVLSTVRTNRTTGKVEDFELVTFTENDVENPKNWSKAYKWYCTMVVAFTCFVVAFCSAVITPDIGGISEEFHVSIEISLITISIFVVGFGVGPMVFAPLSEIVGRRYIYGVTLFVAVILEIPCAVAPNIATLIVCRALDGIAFSAPMTLVGGTLADLWSSHERGVPMAAFSCAPFLGPAIGPLVGGYLSDAKGWRWLYWIQLILAGAAWALITFTVPETYAPTLLKRRAKKMRKDTENSSYVTEQELDPRPFSQRLWLFLIRPFQLLFLEPIVLFMTLYPIVFTEGKGMSPGKTGLMFIPIAVGIIYSGLCAPLVNRHYVGLVRKYNGKPPAEARLIPMMVSCWFVPIGLFIFGWTSYPRLSWAGAAIGGGFPVGFGFLFMYNSANNYLVDTYTSQAASALAAKTFLRSLWGAAVVLFTNQMYVRMGYEWTSTLLAFIALACCAIPYIFYFKGSSIRRWSRYAVADEGQEELGVKA